MLDTSLEDVSVDGYVGYELAENQRLFGRISIYDADTAGFGWVDPEAFDPGSPTIQIRYPYQDFKKYSFGYDGFDLGLPVADRIRIVGYYQRNKRELSNDVFIPFGAPDRGLIASTLNYSDIKTFGLRLESSKLTWHRVLFTYGADLFQDRTTNTDFGVNSYVGFPPLPQFSPDTSDSPRIPNASYRSIGVFAQGDVAISSRLSLILGARAQNLRAATRETPGSSSPLVSVNNSSIVGAAKAVFEVNDHLSLIGTVGRAFRAPNLIEQFFEGPTPEGSGYQSRNDNLEPETSFNIDLGARYSRGGLSLEGFLFRNIIFDGIRIIPTGDSVGVFFEVENANVDKLRFVGVELAGNLSLPAGFSVRGHYTYMNTKDISSPIPTESNDVWTGVGDSYSTKVGGTLRYSHPDNWVFAEYEVRHNGDRKDAFCSLESPAACDASPQYAGLKPAVGWILPAFTVHNARIGVKVMRTESLTHQMGIAVTNITNALFAEFSNASFFRPEAKRGVTVSWNMSF